MEHYKKNIKKKLLDLFQYFSQLIISVVLYLTNQYTYNINKK